MTESPEKLLTPVLSASWDEAEPWTASCRGVKAT